MKLVGNGRELVVTESDQSVGGALSFGRLPSTPNTPQLKYTPMTRNNAHPAYYVVKTSEMKMGDQAVASSGDLSVGYGTVMDSGTTFTYVPTKVFHATAAALDAAVTTGNGAESKLVKVSGPDPGYPDDVCFQRAGATATAPIVTMDNLGDYYPPLTLTFDGEGASLVLPPSNYLFAHGKKPGAFCLGVMDNKSQGTLIGGISVRNVLVEYDKTVDGGRIGFATTNCDAMLADHLARQSGANAKAAGNETNGAGPVVNEVTPPPPPHTDTDLSAGDVNAKSNGYTEAGAGGDARRRDRAEKYVSRGAEFWDIDDAGFVRARVGIVNQARRVARGETGEFGETALAGSSDSSPE